MASPEDLAFGQIAVERKLVTAAQVAECLEAQARDGQLGVFPRSLAEVLLERGYLSRYLVKEVYKAQGHAEGFPAIEGYVLDAKIGHGGMGTVYRARQTSLDRVVAIKVLATPLARDRAFVNRFLREARAVARLNHENIIVGIDVGKSGDHYFFAMEYVDGETVHEILTREGRLPERRALEIARQVALALAHAHEHGLVHRDVKPGNIMVTPEGVAKLCDLGLAKSVQQDGSLTQSGTTHGTPHYMSPEQARGAVDLDVRSDVYSLGATLYHMVVGEVPFTGASAAVILLKHLSETVPSPKQRRPELSDGLCHIIETMMAKKPEQRYQLPQALLHDIDRVLDGDVPQAPRPAAGQSSVLPVSAAAGGPALAPIPATSYTALGGQALAPVPAAPLGADGRPVQRLRGPLVLAGGVALGAVLALAAVQMLPGAPAPPSPGPPATAPTASPSPTPSPDPPRPDPDAERRAREDARAAEFFDRWKQMKEAAPDTHADHIRQLETMLERFGATASAPAIAGALTRERQARAAAADGALAAVLERLPGWLAERRFGAAIDALDGVADRFDGTDAAGGADARARALEEQRTTAQVDLVTAAEQLAARGDFRGAIAELQVIPRLGLPDATADAQARIAELVEQERRRTRELEERADREAREHWLAHSTDLLRRLAATRNHAPVLAELDEAASQPAFARVADWLQRDRALVARAAELFAAAVAALEGLVGKPVALRPARSMRLLEGKLVRIESRMLVVRLAAGGDQKLPFPDIAWEDVLRLSGASGGQGALKFAECCLRLADGELAEARVALDHAVRAGEPVADHVTDLAERAAFAALERARAHWLGFRFREALQELEGLARAHGQSQVVLDHADEIFAWTREAPALWKRVAAVERVGAADPKADALRRLLRLAIEPVAGEPPRVACAAERLPLATLPAVGSFGLPESFFFEGGLDTAKWAPVGTGLHGPAGSRAVFRPRLRADSLLVVGIQFAATGAAEGALLTVCEAEDPGEPDGAPLTVGLDAAGTALWVRERRGGAEPAELLRIDTLRLADGGAHHVALRLAEGRLSIAVDGGPPRGAPALSRAPGHVALHGQGDAVGYRALTVNGAVDPAWVLEHPWVRERMGR